MSRIACIVVLTALLPGCVTYVLTASRDAVSTRLRIVSPESTGYTLRIGESGEIISPEADGLFVVALPAVPRACEEHLWPFDVKLGPAEPTLRVLANGVVRRRIRISELEQLPTGIDGIQFVRVR